MTELSVVIPSYNHRKYILAALRSIEAQSYADFEVVVVDDGSTDGSADLIAEFMAGTPLTIRLERQANAGAHAAIGRGIALARGRHLAILNSDDLFHPDRLAVMMARVPASGPYFAFSEFDFIDAEGAHIAAEIHNRIWYRDLLDRHRFSPGIGFTVLAGNISISTSNFLFSREMYDLAGGFRPYRTAHDLDFLLRCTYHAEPIFVRERLLQYRLHGRNTIDANRDLERREVGELFLDYLDRATLDPPPNERAPASTALAVYSDQVLRRTALWFEARTDGPAFERLAQRAKEASAANPDAEALRGEIDRLTAQEREKSAALPLEPEEPAPQRPEGPVIRLYKAVRDAKLMRPLRAAARAAGLRIPRRWL